MGFSRKFSIFSLCTLFVAVPFVASADTVLTSREYADGKFVSHTGQVGSVTQPVYVASDGTATATTYTLGASVPANAVFTDTTYSAFSGADGTNAGSAGLVPAPTATDNTKFLKGDGTWAADNDTTYSAFSGADGTNAGGAGLVPAPAAADNVKYLKGDGTWAAVPNPSVMTGATSALAGTSGLTPQPAAGDQNKILTGGATWKYVQVPVATGDPNAVSNPGTVSSMSSIWLQ